MNQPGGTQRDLIFQSEAWQPSDFQFDAAVADVFDDMVQRSVPLYAEQQAMISTLASGFWQPDSVAYDLGCSTGTTLIDLARRRPAGGSLIGYDNSADMLAKAAGRLETAGVTEQVDLRLADLNGDLAQLPLDGASFVVMAWTLQFVRPIRRPELLSWIERHLQTGGALVVCEKVLAGDPKLNRRFVDFYYDYKRTKGYSNGEIARKREALENVLVPYRIDEDVALLHQAGFARVETFFQWFNFAGFLCLKQ